MIIIGITGTIGAGKGTIVEYLTHKYGYQHFSVRTFLSKLLKEQGLLPDRDNLTELANKLRAEHGPSYVTDCLFEEALRSEANCVIESIRTPGEIYSLRKNPSFFLFSVDADPQLRYRRILERNTETDRIDFLTFVSNEQREMSSDDPNKQNLRKCIELADFSFTNNSERESLFLQLEAALSKIDKNYE